MEAGTKQVDLDWQRIRVQHEDAAEWLSEIEFMTDEITFFAEVIKDYFMALAIKDFEHEKELIKNRQTISNEVFLMKQRMQEHHEHLAALVAKKASDLEERDQEREHFEVAAAFKCLRKEFINYKKDLFKTVTEASRLQKQKSLTL